MDALAAVPNRWRTVKAHGTAVGLPSDADMGELLVYTLIVIGVISCCYQV